MQFIDIILIILATILFTNPDFEQAIESRKDNLQ